MTILCAMSCTQEKDYRTVDGVWTSFESMDDNTPKITLAFQDTNLLWLTGFGEMKLLSYRIVGDSIYFFDQLDGYWQQSIHYLGRFERINDSIIWLNSTPLEVEILERSRQHMDKETFENIDKVKLRRISYPWYRKE